MKTSYNGITLIKEFEGCRLKAYKDMVGVWTIGYGFTKNVKAGDTLTKEQCEAKLLEELQEYEAAVLSSVRGEVTQAQFDAMVSLTWNIGISGFRKSTVLKAHLRGDYQAASRAFGLWNKAGGREVGPNSPESGRSFSVLNTFSTGGIRDAPTSDGRKSSSY
jgi:lysozyme